MSALAAPAALPAAPRGGIWRLAWRRLQRDRVGLAALWVVAAFALVMLLCATGVVAADWQDEVGVPGAPPAWLGAATAEGSGGAPIANEAAAAPRADLSALDPLAARYAEWEARASTYRSAETPRRPTLPLGGDRLGRDVLAKVLQGSLISIAVGVGAALGAGAIGTALGALAGFVGGRVGDALEWLYNVFESVPNILLVFAFAAVSGRGIAAVVVILALTGWTGMYRQMRGEFLRHATRDYVRAAEALAIPPLARMFRHVLPNVAHLILVRVSLLVVASIKAEVVLSYLGLGVRIDQVSWGTMLAEAQGELLLGRWWQLAAVTAFMAVFVTAFSLATDALRDALDPRLAGLE